MMSQTEQRISIIFNHFRHATSSIEFGKTKIIIDPMLSDKHSLMPVTLTKNKLKNPLVSLPLSTDNILKDIDHVLLTHLHFDHFDKRAIQIIPKSTSIICSKSDRRKLKNYGFLNIYPISRELKIGDLRIARYPAKHGKGLIRLLLGKGSSYLIEFKGFKVFITGDCLLTRTLKHKLNKIKPDIVIANGGAAEFRFGKPITMSINDIRQISTMLKNSKIIVVHLDALNHCSETRLNYFEKTSDFPNIIIPNDGEIIKINNIA